MQEEGEADEEVVLEEDLIGPKRYNGYSNGPNDIGSYLRSRQVPRQTCQDQIHRGQRSDWLIERL